MTLSNLTKTLLAASALTVLAAAPAAYAADAASAKPSNGNFASHVDGRRDRLRGDRIRGDRNRSDRLRGDRNRDRHIDRHADHNHDHLNFRDNRRTRTRFRNARRINRNYSPYRYNNRGRYNSPYRTRNSSAFYNPYRSHVGISFNFGSPRYSGYRWARSPYSLYNSSYGSYSGYQSSTVCRRVNRIAYHHGHEELISVKECSNPYSGTYIVQGSERVIDCRY